MIVKDEQLVLERALNCAKKFADEVIVVDTGSCDRTKEIAKQAGARVFDYVWCDDFSRARNFAFSKATKSHMMWLDADDYITNENIDKINRLKAQRDCADVYFMKYATAFDARNKPTFCFVRERLVRNSPAFYFRDPIHEAITPSGKIVHTNIVIEHRKIKPSDPQRNLKIYEKLIAQHVKFSPRMQFYYASELFYNNEFQKAINVYNSFLSLKDGFVENQIQACLNRAQCYHKLGQTTRAIESLLASFTYGAPRSEILCELSLYLIALARYREALYWLKLAIQRADLNSGGFVLPDCYDFIPYYNSSICYYKLGQTALAVRYAKKACKIKPTSVDARRNLNYFKSLL